METKKLKLESLKALIDGLKVKILLFSGAFGGSFALILKSEKLLPTLFFSMVVFIFLIGIIVNLLKLKQYLNEIERIKDECRW